MSSKSRSLNAILLICLGISILASLIAASGWLDIPELKTVDSRFRLRYWLNRELGRSLVSDEVVLVAIDQKSVDPGYSEFSDRWGMGGWLTRDFWTQAVYNFASFYKPRAVAYDLLFIPYRPTSGVSSEGIEWIEQRVREGGAAFGELTLEADFPRLELFRLVDASGNAAFADSFNNIEMAREDGRQVPDFLTAYYFTRVGPDSAEAWNEQRTADREKIQELRQVAIPLDRIKNIPSDYPYFDNAELPYDSLAGAAVQLGFINVDRDADGSIRRIPLVQGFQDPATGEPIFVSSLALKSCMIYLGVDPVDGIEVDFGRDIRLFAKEGEIRIPIDSHGSLFLNFEGKVNDFKPVSYADLNRYGPYDERARTREGLTPDELSKAGQIRKRLEGKIALIGVVFTGATDVGPCAIDSNAPFSLIHLTAMDNILRQRFLAPMGALPASLVLWVVVLLVGAANLATQARVNALGSLLLIVGYLMLAYGLFLTNTVCLPVVLPSLSMIVAFGGISLFRYQVEQKARLEIRRKFGAMVSRDVLEYLEEHPDSFALGGERREATIFFSDVAGFTRVSETLSPSELVEVINAYLTPMSEAILAHKGYLNKYLGDGIMAVWGAPVAMADHAERACRAALEQQERIAALRPVFRERYNVELHVRMGVNSGAVDAGNMGSLDRLEYTVMGDAVNLAARLEPANKDYGTSIILGRSTRALIRETSLATRLLDRIVVQGKTERVEIYELLGTTDEMEPDRLKAIAIFEEGLQLYWKRSWGEAIGKLEEALRHWPADRPSQALIERIRVFQVQPPPEDWQGETVRAKKD